MFMQFLLEILCLCNFWASKNYPAIIRRLVLPHLLIKRKEFDVDATVGLVDGRRVPVHLSWRDWGWLGWKQRPDKHLKAQTYLAGILDSWRVFNSHEIDLKKWISKESNTTPSLRDVFSSTKVGQGVPTWIHLSFLDLLHLYQKQLGKSLSETAWKIVIRNGLEILSDTGWKILYLSIPVENRLCHDRHLVVPVRTGIASLQ